MFWVFVLLAGYGFMCLSVGIVLGKSRAYGEMADAMREAKARSAANRARPE